jgi:uncharacterized membrane protein
MAMKRTPDPRVRAPGTTSGAGAKRVTSAGHAAFAAAMIGVGVLGLVKRDFAPIWPPVPEGLPGRTLLMYLCGLIPVACGLGLIVQRTAAAAARVLLAFFVAWLLLLRLPLLVMSFTVDVWWASSQTAVMVAAAWALYVRIVGDGAAPRRGFPAGDVGLGIARTLYGLGLIPFGLAHFIYLQATTVLVPGWLPWPDAWAYLTGATFIAAGVAVLIRVWARLAATLSALQMAMFALVVWAPRVAAGTLNAFQWGEVVTTLVLSAAAWVVAESYRGIPWLAVGQG